jgi:hemophore-related protein
MLTTRNARRLSLAIVASAALVCLSPLANAEPPNCTSGDLEGVRAGVDASTSAYLFTHPDLNAFMSGVQGLSREQVAEQVKGYMATHPQENAEMTGIRQPLVDLKNHCGALSP